MTQDYRDLTASYRFRVESAAPTLARELADRDARLLLDIGLLRAEDGTLRLAEDPGRQATPTAARRGFAARFRAWLGGLQRRPAPRLQGCG